MKLGLHAFDLPLLFSRFYFALVQNFISSISSALTQLFLGQKELTSQKKGSVLGDKFVSTAFQSLFQEENME